MEDDSPISCTSCDIIVSSSYAVVEAVCIDCRVKVSRCHACGVKFPALDGSMEKREERLLKEVAQLRLGVIMAERERNNTCGLFEVLQKQSVRVILFWCDAQSTKPALMYRH